VQQLYVLNFDDPLKPFLIVARNPNSTDTNPGPFIKIDEIAHIFYGYLNDTSIPCESIMYGYEFINNATSADGLQYSVTLKPKLMDMMPEGMVNYQSLDITIEGDNELSIKMQDTNAPYKRVFNDRLRKTDFNVTVDSILDQ
jgi:hypothetical protein